MKSRCLLQKMCCNMFMITGMYRQYLLSCKLLLSAISYHHVGDLLPKTRHNTLKAALFSCKPEVLLGTNFFQLQRARVLVWGENELNVTYFSGAVDVLHRENVPQAVEKNLRQGRNQLSGGHQNIHTSSPAHKTKQHQLTLNFNVLQPLLVDCS